jgi:hypothetical protein
MHYTGGPAFPTDSYDLERGAVVREEGMTLRDYFAAKAMQGFMTRAQFTVRDWNGEAEAAYQVADAMLLARAE